MGTHPYALALLAELTRAEARLETAVQDRDRLAAACRSLAATYPQIGASIGMTESGARAIVRRHRKKGGA